MHSFVFWAFAAVVAYSVFRSFLLRKGRGSAWTNYVRGTTGYINPISGALSIYGAVVGGFIVFGLMQIGFEGGLTGYILGLAYVLGIPLLLFALNRASENGLVGKGFVGIDAILLARFGRFTETMFVIVTILLFSGVLAGQFIAVSAFLKEFTGRDYAVVTLVIGCLCTVLYTIIFGLRAVLANDIVQGLFEGSLSVVIPAVILYQVWGKQPTFVPWSDGIGGKYGAAYPIIGGIFLALSFIARADLWQRLVLVERKKQKYVIAFVAIGLFIYYMGMTTAGIIIHQNPESFPFVQNVPLSSLVPLIIRELVTNPFVQILCISGLLIALLSSIDSYLNLIGLLVAKLFLFTIDSDQGLSEEQKEKVKLVNARIATMGAAFATIIIAFIIPDLVDIISASFGLLGILVPVVFIALKRSEKMPDYVGAVPILVSLSLLLVSIPLLKKLAFVPATVLGAICFVILLYFGRPKRVHPLQDAEES